MASLFRNEVFSFLFSFSSIKSVKNVQFLDRFKNSLKYFYYFLHSHLMSNQIDTISLSINFQDHLCHSDDLLLWVGVHRRAITVSPSETFPTIKHT